MLRETLENRFDAQLADAVPVSGGDINAAYRLTLTDGTCIFMKANRTASPAFFQAEADGLAAIRGTGVIGVPAVIAAGNDERYGSFLLLEWIEAAPQKRDFWETFGHGLAKMHLADADHFGWKRDNYIGSTPQVNAPRFNQWTKADTTRLDEVSVKLTDEAKLNTKPVTLQSLLLLIGCAFLVSAIATNVGAKLYGWTGFSDKATWTVLFVTAVALVCALTPLGKVAGSGEVSNLLLYAVIGLLASRASLSELGDAPAWIITGFIVLAIYAALMLLICKLLKLDLFTAGVASLANIGGTASAPVLAGSYSGSLVPVGILMALMGYVVGTPLATLCANIMRLLA